VPFHFLLIFHTGMELSRENSLARRLGSANWTSSLPRRLYCTEHRMKRLSPLRESVPRLLSSEITLSLHESCLRYFSRNGRNQFVPICVFHLVCALARRTSWRRLRNVYLMMGQATHSNGRTIHGGKLVARGPRSATYFFTKHEVNLKK
jgi:hypothetical protein